MLVLTRKTNESVCIDDFEVTVGWIRFNKVQLLTNGSGEVEPFERILYVEENHELAPEITIIVILFKEDKVHFAIGSQRYSRWRDIRGYVHTINFREPDHPDQWSR